MLVIRKVGCTAAVSPEPVPVSLKAESVAAAAALEATPDFALIDMSAIKAAAPLYHSVIDCSLEVQRNRNTKG